MKLKTTWVVVADEAIARILERPRDGGELVPVEELTDPGAHAKESELHGGSHGRRVGVAGSRTSQATVSAGDSERHRLAQAFATRIAQRLAQHHRARRFDALHLVAAPRLLGYLRTALDADVSALVMATLDKDVAQESNAELTRRLFKSPASTP